MPEIIKFWIRNTNGSEAFEFMEFEHNADPQAIRTALEKWADSKYANWISKGVEYGAERTTRPPSDWLVERLVQLKSNVMREMAAIEHYKWTARKPPALAVGSGQEAVYAHLLEHRIAFLEKIIKLYCDCDCDKRPKFDEEHWTFCRRKIGDAALAAMLEQMVPEGGK